MFCRFSPRWPTARLSSGSVDIVWSVSICVKPRKEQVTVIGTWVLDCLGNNAQSLVWTTHPTLIRYSNSLGDIFKKRTHGKRTAPTSLPLLTLGRFRSNFIGLYQNFIPDMLLTALTTLLGTLATALAQVEPQVPMVRYEVEEKALARPRKERNTYTYYYLCGSGGNQYISYSREFS